MLPAKPSSGLEKVLDAFSSSSVASVNVTGSTVRARLQPTLEILHQVCLEDAHPFVLAAVVSQRPHSQAALFLREKLPEAVSRVLSSAAPSERPDTPAAAKVPPLSTALLRVSRKYTKVHSSESILTDTDSAIALVDVLAHTVHIVTCGRDAKEPVVTDGKGQRLARLHSNVRKLGPIFMEEATYGVPSGHCNVVLGSPELWNLVHPSKASLYAATYAAAPNLSTADHAHDAASAILRAALRAITHRCATSPSARTSVLNSLAQLDRLPLGSRYEACHMGKTGFIPRMRGDIHPDFTAAVVSVNMLGAPADGASAGGLPRLNPRSAVPPAAQLDLLSPPGSPGTPGVTTDSGMLLSGAPAGTMLNTHMQRGARPMQLCQQFSGTSSCRSCRTAGSGAPSITGTDSMELTPPTPPIDGGAGSSTTASSAAAEGKAGGSLGWWRAANALFLHRNLDKQPTQSSLLSSHKSSHHSNSRNGTAASAQLTEPSASEASDGGHPPPRAGSSLGTCSHCSIGGIPEVPSEIERSSLAAGVGGVVQGQARGPAREGWVAPWLTPAPTGTATAPAAAVRPVAGSVRSSSAPPASRTSTYGSDYAPGQRAEQAAGGVVGWFSEGLNRIGQLAKIARNLTVLAITQPDRVATVLDVLDDQVSLLEQQEASTRALPPPAPPGSEGDTEAARRWALVRRHVRMQGLERQLRLQMWHDAVDAALMRHRADVTHVWQQDGQGQGVRTAAEALQVQLDREALARPPWPASALAEAVAAVPQSGGDATGSSKAIKNPLYLSKRDRVGEAGEEPERDTEQLLGARVTSTDLLVPQRQQQGAGGRPEDGDGGDDGPASYRRPESGPVKVLCGPAIGYPELRELARLAAKHSGERLHRLGHGGGGRGGGGSSEVAERGRPRRVGLGPRREGLARFWGARWRENARQGRRRRGGELVQRNRRSIGDSNWVRSAKSALCLEPCVGVMQ